MPKLVKTGMYLGLFFSKRRGSTLPLSTKELVVSQPVKAWNDSSALHSSGPTPWMADVMLIRRLLLPTLVSMSRGMSMFCE